MRILRSAHTPFFVLHLIGSQTRAEMAVGHEVYVAVGKGEGASGDTSRKRVAKMALLRHEYQTRAHGQRASGGALSLKLSEAGSPDFHPDPHEMGHGNKTKTPA